MPPYNQDPIQPLGRPLELPCGTVLKNRLIKSAMSDSLGDGAGNPTEPQMRLYERWADGGVALALIGEVQTQPYYPEKPGNLVLANGVDLSALGELARRGSANSAHIWPQLGHAGALSYAPISRPKGPSALHIDDYRCEELPLDEIRELPASYESAARLAKDAGFGGVQIHAGHGFLLSQFLSPLFNRRTDPYGGSIEKRFRIIREVIDEIRTAIGPAMAAGIKINSTDQLVGGLTTEDALEVVQLLDQTSIDLIEISGGTYFPGAASSSDGTASSGPYFSEFARSAKDVTSVPVAVTGGFKTRSDAISVLESGRADAVGIARALALDPALADMWLSEDGGEVTFPRFKAPAPGAVTAWYSMRLTALGEGAENDFDMTAADALSVYNKRDEARCATWRRRFL